MAPPLNKTPAKNPFQRAADDEFGKVAASENPFVAAAAEEFSDAGVPDDVDAGEPVQSAQAAKGTLPPGYTTPLDKDKPTKGAYGDLGEGAFHSLTGGTYVNKLFDKGVNALNRAAGVIGLPSADHTIDGQPARYAGRTASGVMREKPVEQAREAHPEHTAAGEGVLFSALAGGGGKAVSTVAKGVKAAAPAVRGLVKPLVGLADDVVKAVPKASGYVNKLRSGAGAVAKTAKKAGAEVQRYTRDATEALPGLTGAAKLVGQGATGLGAAAAARGAQLEDNRVEQIAGEFAADPMSTALIAAAPVIGGQAVGSEARLYGDRLKGRANEKLGRAVAPPKRADKNVKHGHHQAFRNDGERARKMGLTETSASPNDNPLKGLTLDRLATNVENKKPAQGAEVRRTHENVMGASTGRTRELPDGTIVNEEVGDVAVPVDRIQAQLDEARRAYEYANAPEKAEIVHVAAGKLKPQPYTRNHPQERHPLPPDIFKLRPEDRSARPNVTAPLPAAPTRPADPPALNVTLPSSGASGAPQLREPMSTPPAPSSLLQRFRSLIRPSTQTIGQPQPRPRPQPSQPPTPGPALGPQPAPPTGVATPHQPGVPPVGPHPAPSSSLPPRNAPAATQPAAPAGHYPQPKAQPRDLLTDWEEEQELLQHNLGARPETPAGQFPAQAPSRREELLLGRLNLGRNPAPTAGHLPQPELTDTQRFEARHGFRPSLGVPNLTLNDSPERWLEEQALGRLNLGSQPQPTLGHHPQPEIKGVPKFQAQSPRMGATPARQAETVRPRGPKPENQMPAPTTQPPTAAPAVNPPVEPPANLGALPESPVGAAPSAGHYPQPKPVKAQPNKQKPPPNLGARPETPAGYYPQPAKLKLPQSSKQRPTMEPQNPERPYRPEVPKHLEQKPAQPKYALRNYGAQTRPKPRVVNGPKPTAAPTRLNLAEPKMGESFHRGPMGLGTPDLEPEFKQFAQEGKLAKQNLGRFPAPTAGTFPSRPYTDFDLEEPKLLGPANPPPFPQTVEPNQMKLNRPQLDLGGPSFQDSAPRAPRFNLALPEQQGADPSRVRVGQPPLAGIAQPLRAPALLQPQPAQTRTPFQAPMQLRAPDPEVSPHYTRPQGSYVRPPEPAPKFNLLPDELRVDEPGRYQPKPFPFAAISGPNAPIPGTGPHPQPSLGHFPQLEEPTLGSALHPQPPAGLNPQPAGARQPDPNQWLRGGIAQMRPEPPQPMDPMPLTRPGMDLPLYKGPKLLQPLPYDPGPSHFTLRQADAVQRDLMKTLRNHQRPNNKPLKAGEEDAIRPIAYGLNAEKKKMLKQLEENDRTNRKYPGDEHLPSLLTDLPEGSIGGPGLGKQLTEANANLELSKGIEDRVAQGATLEQKGSGTQGTIHQLLGEQRSLHNYGSIFDAIGKAVGSPDTARAISAGMSGYRGSKQSGSDYREANDQMKKELEEERNGTNK